jgi:hypothetical protein
MDQLTAALDALVPTLGEAAVKGAKTEIKRLADDAASPVAQVALALAADAVEAHGAEGIDIARRTIQRLVQGRTVAIEWADPRTASDVVAMLQNAEREDRKAARRALQVFGEVTARIGAAVIKAALKA